LTDLSADDYGRFCASKKSDRVWENVTPITNDGQMRTSLRWGFLR
jgi:hypothetical protein